MGSHLEMIAAMNNVMQSRSLSISTVCMAQLPRGNIVLKINSMYLNGYFNEGVWGHGLAPTRGPTRLGLS